MTITKTASRYAAAILASTLACAGGSPAPTGPTSSIAGRWTGVSPEGMIVDVLNGQCPEEFDLELNLTSSTSGEIGTATTKLRKTRCSDVLNGVHTYTLTKGSVGSDSIAFDFANGAYHFSGTFTGSRMTGTFVITEFPQSGHFIVYRQ